MRKRLMILLGMITVIACIGLTACGSSDSEAEAPAEDTAAEEDKPKKEGFFKKKKDN